MHGSAGIQTQNTKNSTDNTSEPVVSKSDNDAERIIYICDISSSSKTIDLYAYSEEEIGKIPPESLSIDTECKYYDADGNEMDFYQIGNYIAVKYRNNNSATKCRVCFNDKGFAVQINIL